LGNIVHGKYEVKLVGIPGARVREATDSIEISYDHVAKIKKVEMDEDYPSKELIHPYIAPNNNKYKKRNAVETSPDNKLMTHDCIYITKYVKKIELEWVYPQQKKYVNKLAPADAIGDNEACVVIQPSPDIQIDELESAAAQWSLAYTVLPGAIVAGVTEGVAVAIYGAPLSPAVSIVAGIVGFVLGTAAGFYADLKDLSKMHYKFLRIPRCKVSIENGESLSIQVIEGSAELYDYNFSHISTIEENQTLIIDKNDNTEGIQELDIGTIDSETMEFFADTHEQVKTTEIEVVTGTSLFIKDYSKPQGSKVSIPVHIKEAENLGNMDLSISYDSSVLKATGYEKGSLTSGSLLEANIAVDTVYIAFTDSNGLNGDGTIIYIDFTVVGDEGDTCQVTPEVIIANEVEIHESITVSTESGKFTVRGMKGDANGDGRITAVDAFMALKMAVGSIPVELVCDMNGDGSVTSLDATLIREEAVSL